MNANDKINQLSTKNIALCSIMQVKIEPAVHCISSVMNGNNIKHNIRSDIIIELNRNSFFCASSEMFFQFTVHNR